MQACVRLVRQGSRGKNRAGQILHADVPVGFLATQAERTRSAPGNLSGLWKRVLSDQAKPEVLLARLLCAHSVRDSRRAQVIAHPLVNKPDKMADTTAFARELGFLIDRARLHALGENGHVDVDEKARLEAALIDLCQPVYTVKQSACSTG